MKYNGLVLFYIHPVSQARTQPKRDVAETCKMAEKSRIDARMCPFGVANRMLHVYRIIRSKPQFELKPNQTH
jgi:hypothetical protein